jgi:hypothetical protein
MADTKISALPASTTPLAGTEVLPIVQSGATKQVSVANLTAGRAVSAASVTASTGNFIVGTAGQGIDFSATPGTGTSELLNDYEEGTWTPELSSSGATFTYSAATGGTYVKVGNVVTLHGILTLTNATGGTAGNALFFSNLPFAPGNPDVSGSGTGIGIWSMSSGITLPANYAMWMASVRSGTSVLPFYSATNGAGIRTFQYGDITSTAAFQFSLTYQT